MSRHNYSQYSSKKRENEPVRENRIYTPPTVYTNDEPAVMMGPIEVKPVEETVNTVSLPKIVNGVVANCARLNVREAPNAEAPVMCMLDVDSEIKINMAKSTDDWFSVCTVTGVEGYCMRKFINARL